MFCSNLFNKSALLTLVAASASLSCIAEKLVPAGSLIQCTVSETKLSSKTVAIGDPVLCQVSRSNVFPYGTVLSGRFEDYKDPGHLIGKGWMELVFDRLILPSNDIIQISSKVVAVPHYSVDLEGKILGKGHPVRDTVEWLIPVLWPLDLMNLPRRGPRPTLKNESRITIKVMDDLQVPDMAPTTRNQYGFAERSERAEPIVYSGPGFQGQDFQDTQAIPDNQLILLDFKFYGFVIATEYWDAGHGKIGYRAKYYGDGRVHDCFASMDALDVDRTIDMNRRNGIAFHVPGNYRASNEPVRNNNAYSFAPMYQDQSSGRQRSAPSQGFENHFQSGGGGRRH